jgi:hypothetical protein
MFALFSPERRSKEKGAAGKKKPQPKAAAFQTSFAWTLPDALA